MSDTPTASPDVVAKRMTDFSPRLSPMLVKELRQGMRTNMFVIAFILLHSFMILCLLTAMSDPGSSDADGFFWFVIITVLLFVQPLRGFSALSSEYQLNTMDLIHMTRLNGWRITLGKWTALNAQGLLFVTGVLPYLVIRYFLGNVNFLGDLLGLLLIGLGSALATAITIGCSAFPNIILRGAACIGLAILMSSLGAAVTNTLSRGSSSGSIEWEFIGVLVLVMVFGSYYFLAFGASRISPLSENLATRKRLAAIITVAICVVLAILDFDDDVLAAMICAVLCVASIDALTEPLPVFARVLSPFSKNPLTRLFGIFLSPGWISGIFFYLLATALVLGYPLLSDGVSFTAADREDVLFLLSASNAAIFPLLIIALFFPAHSGSRFTFALYMLIQGVVFGITIMVAAISSAIGRWEELVFSLVPLPSVLMVAREQGELRHDQFAVIVPLTTLICVLVPLIRGRRQLGEFFRNLNPKR